MALELFFVSARTNKRHHHLFVCLPRAHCDAMTVKHIVLMKFKADTPAESMEKASSNLLALKGAPTNTLTRACSTAKAREEGKGSRGTLLGCILYLWVRVLSVSPVHTADTCDRVRPTHARAN
jgi:hypothetical protein